MSILSWFKKTPKDPVLEALRTGHCPDCNGTSFFMGPHGGGAQNIKCATPTCGSKFNCAPFDDGWAGEPFFVERLPKDPSETVNS